jgi:hypothetical protein
VTFCDRFGGISTIGIEQRTSADNGVLFYIFFFDLSTGASTTNGIHRDDNLQEQWLQTETGNDDKKKRMVILYWRRSSLQSKLAKLRTAGGRETRTFKSFCVTSILLKIKMARCLLPRVDAFSIFRN